MYESIHKNRIVLDSRAFTLVNTLAVLGRYNLLDLGKKWWRLSFFMGTEDIECSNKQKDDLSYCVLGFGFVLNTGYFAGIYVQQRSTIAIVT